MQLANVAYVVYTAKDADGASITSIASVRVEDDTDTTFASCGTGGLSSATRHFTDYCRTVIFFSQTLAQ